MSAIMSGDKNKSFTEILKNKIAYVTRHKPYHYCR